jgi:hypothetical protein
LWIVTVRRGSTRLQPGGYMPHDLCILTFLYTLIPRNICLVISLLMTTELAQVFFRFMRQNGNKNSTIFLILHNNSS